MIGISSIVLEIATGLILSPQILELFPKEYAECAFKLDHDCDNHDALNAIQDHYEQCDYQTYMTKRQGVSLLPPVALVGGRLLSVEDVFQEEEDYRTSSDRTLISRRSPFISKSPLATGIRRLKTDQKGETKYNDYDECLKKACDLEVAHECQLTPNIFTFTGHVGVALMIFESGMHFDFEQAKQSGGWSCIVAVIGTILPLITGSLLIMLLVPEADFAKDGLSAGTSLAPTSVGIALKLLNEAKQLKERHGQIIITAAFVDDILSLVLFNVLFSMADGEITFVKTFLPAICGVIGMGIILVFAATYAEQVMMAVVRLAPNEKKQEELLFFMMIIMVLIFGVGFWLSGTHLWGCFMAGMCLASVHSAHHCWVKQTKRVTAWLLRIFFACTVAFSIPLDELFDPKAVWKGALMGIGPCILTKVSCAFFMGDMACVIGWAMVGRAEFAYLIAQMAMATNMMSKDVFAVVIWSLLWATVFAPFLFRWVLNDFVKRKARKSGKAIDEPQSQDLDPDFYGMDSPSDEKYPAYLFIGDGPLGSGYYKMFIPNQTSGDKKGYTWKQGDDAMQGLGFYLDAVLQASQPLTYEGRDWNNRVSI